MSPTLRNPLRPGRGDGGSEHRNSRPGGGQVGRKVLLRGLVALVVLYGLALWFLAPSTSGRALSFDALSRDAACAAASGAPAKVPIPGSCDKADKVVTSARFLDEDARLLGTIVDKKGGPPERFWASYPRSDAATNDLLKQLVASNAKVSIDAQGTKRIVRFVAQFVLPLVILALLFTLLLSVSGKDSSGVSELVQFGRLGNKRHKQKAKERAPTTFAEVAGAPEAIVELAEVRDYLADPSSFAALGALPPKGVLLVGPPGCGKTLLARAVAGEAAASFYPIAASEFVESLVGVGAARVRDLFAQARENAPAIIFIDELDAVGRQRGAGVGQGHDEREHTLNEMLVQMDGFSPSEGVVVIAATNRPDILDPALLRAGRFDRRITVERPDVDGRLEILGVHASGKRLADPDVDLAHVASRTPGFTGADLASLLNEAALLAVRDRSGAVSRHHLEEAVERVQVGPRRRVQVITPEEKRRIACHEAGHAVVAAAVGMAGALQKVSIISRGQGVGHLSLLDEDKVVFTQPDMEARIAIAMAGIAAEVASFGHPSTGSEQDLERATAIARDMAGRYGMSTRIGRVRVLRDRGEVFLGRDFMAAGDVSQPTLEHLDGEVRRILDEQEAVAREILQAHAEILDGLASALVAEETLQGSHLEAMLGAVGRHQAHTPSGTVNGARPARRRSTSS